MAEKHDIRGGGERERARLYPLNLDSTTKGGPSTKCSKCPRLWGTFLILAITASHGLHTVSSLFAVVNETHNMCVDMYGVPLE